MPIKINFDNERNVVTPVFVLANRRGDKLGAIPATNITLSDNFNSSFELQFEVNKYNHRGEGDLAGTKYELWDELTSFKLVWCRDWNLWFEIYVNTADESGVTKQVTCTSLAEAELSQITIYDMQVNTEDDISRDDYEPTVLYNPDKPGASLLNRVLEKAPHYKIGHVDSSIASIQRTFELDGSIYDVLVNTVATEIDCIFIFDSSTDDDGNIARTINAYDLESVCNDCGNRDLFIDQCTKCGSTNVTNGYGTETSVYISKDNLASSITLDEDTSSVKNCFRLEGGDDLMTATIMSCNPNGSRYIWYFTDAMKHDMPSDLVEKLNSYDELYKHYRDEYQVTVPDGNDGSNLVTKYNTLVDKYHSYNDELEKIPAPMVGYSGVMNAYYNTINMGTFLESELMPTVKMEDTTAAKEAAKLTEANMSPVAVKDKSIASAATVSSSALSLAKVYVDPRYRVKVKTSSYSDGKWTGNFTVTSYSDDDETADSPTIVIDVTDDYETFVRQKLDKVLKDEDNGSDKTSISGMFKLSESEFKAELKKYCLDSLKAFLDACKACIDILVEQGLADKQTWGTKNPDLYTEIYLDYYNKLADVEAEVSVRESEIAVVEGKKDASGNIVENGVQTELEKQRDAIKTALNLEKYLGTDLWLTFSAYRREDEYQNSNYISDGLSTSELFKRAREFLDVAEKELYKSATRQYSIDASLNDLLTMKEFEPIVDNFSVGNWIRVRVDEDVYRLRLLSYTISFSDLSTLTVTFSNGDEGYDVMTDIKSVLDQAKTMATSYDAITRQATDGKDSKAVLSKWVDNGLSLTNMKIVSSADNQAITYDSHGILCREYVPETDTYSDEQLKIFNRGLYVTSDNWKTAKAGIGKFEFYNPKTKATEESYGVIADTLVGNLILSSEVGIYNESGSTVIDENGVTITADASATADGDEKIFCIQKKDGDTYTPYMYMTRNGNFMLTASSQEAVFNALTNGGKAKGVYLKDGSLYIDADFIQSGTLSGRTLIFGDEPNTVELKPNDDGNGGEIAGNGKIKLDSKNGLDLINTSDTNGSEAGLIRLYNSSTANFLTMVNYKTSKATSGISNLDSDRANGWFLRSNKETAYSDSDSVRGNYFVLYNYNTQNSNEANRIECDAYDDRTYMRLFNRDHITGANRNYLTLLAYGDSNQTWLMNNNIDNNLYHANQIQQYSSSSLNKTVISNYSPDENKLSNSLWYQNTISLQADADNNKIDISTASMTDVSKRGGSLLINTSSSMNGCTMYTTHSSMTVGRSIVYAMHWDSGSYECAKSGIEANFINGKKIGEWLVEDRPDISFSGCAMNTYATDGTSIGFIELNSTGNNANVLRLKGNSGIKLHDSTGTLTINPSSNMFPIKLNDGSYFTRGDGRVYLYWSGSHVRASIDGGAADIELANN